MFMIGMAVSIILLSNCNLFLALQIWLSIVNVNVKTNLLVVADNDNVEIVNICCKGKCYFL